jgi:hypothetical protein
VTQLVSDPTNRSHLLLLSTSVVFNTSADSGGSGAAIVSASEDDGVTWATQAVPAAANWSDPSSAVCGQRFDGAGTATFTSNGTAVFVGETAPWPSAATCDGPVSHGALYLSERFPDQASWTMPVPVAGDAGGLRAYGPAVAINPVDSAILVAFVEVVSGTPLLEIYNSTLLAGSNPLTVAVGSAMSVQLAAPAERPGSFELVWELSGSIFAAWSDDGGASFSAPVVLASGILTPTTPASLAGRSVALGVVPGGTGLFVLFVNTTPSESFSDVAVVIGVVDSSTGWGVPAVLWVSSDIYFQPSAAALPDGQIAVTWLSQDPATGTYQTLGGLFEDAPWFNPGTTQPFPLGSASSTPEFTWNGSTLSTGSIGNDTSIAATSSGFVAAWTDLRSGAAQACGGCATDPARNESVYLNRFVPVVLNTNLPAVTITAEGLMAGNGSELLNTSFPPGAWAGELGTPFTIAAPATAVVDHATWSFASWIGSAFSPDATLTGRWSNSANLTACYVPAPGDLCTLAGSPGQLVVDVTPTDATGTLGGQPFEFSDGVFSELLAPGYYPLEVQAAGYVSLIELVSISSGAPTLVSANLSPDGRIAGWASPASASLTIGDQAVDIGPSGAFAVNVTPGTYGIRMTAPDYAPYDGPSVDVGPGETVNLYLGLQGLAELFGTVSPSDAIVSWGGLVANRSGDTYTLTVPAGVPVELAASAQGFAPLSTGPFNLWIGEKWEANLSLPAAPGWIDAVIAPNASTVEINGTVVDSELPVGAALNLSESAGWYYLNVSATGFQPYTTIVTIYPGTTTWTNVSLTENAPSLVGPPLSGTSLLEGLVLDAALLGGLAAVFVIARRPRVNPSGDGTAR